jgi:dipeptidyl aminopeptidase/acylaminoacyl peptidase
MALSLGAEKGYAQSRGFTVQDSIAMARFSDPSGYDREAEAKFSPDGRYFAVVTSRGLIESNEIESTLWLFDVDSVRSFLQNPGPAPAPKPKVLMKLAAVPSGPEVISELRWGTDARTIYLLAQGRDAGHQLYRVDINRGTAKAITSASDDVRAFDVAGDIIAYKAGRPARDDTVARQLPGESVNADAWAVTGAQIAPVLFPKPSGAVRVLCIRRGKLQQVDDPGSLRRATSEGVLSVSPHGRWMVQTLRVEHVPNAWESYEPPPGAETERIYGTDVRNSGQTSSYGNLLSQYALANLENGKTIFLIDAPEAFVLSYRDRDQAVWSRDERRLLLTNTFLPLEGVDTAERLRRLRPCAVADVEVPSGKVNCIVFSRFDRRYTAGTGPELLEDASFGTDNDEVILQFGGFFGQRGHSERYHYERDSWALVESLQAASPFTEALRPSKRQFLVSSDSLAVMVKQNLNDPPALWVTNRKSGKGKRLWDPNPQFAGLRFGETSVYRWRDESGYEWTGGLIKPVDYLPGKLYPLVIQTHGFWDWQFMTDGAYPSAMAARPLASAGFVVLQTSYRDDIDFSLEDVPVHIREFEGAIKQLATEGLIDPQKVGVIGFSWSAHHVEGALIWHPSLFAAATIADGVDNSYMQYHLWGGEAGHYIENNFEKTNGGKPLGQEGLKKWMEAALDFHLDRVQTPLRIEARGPASLLGEWEIYSSLWHQTKPVELIYIPQGQHVSAKPLERMASQQGNVDWFRFWLQGYEDPDPGKKSQNERWRHLRELQEEDEKKVAVDK